ncbi:MAG TPA: sigma-70 family RNA polymerase sigma factor [Bryobacteraceae bacterium]|jgi:RNA polymerase sigma-70 factor (ECF subfamily)|nr:sigma-70 family RNA polymerase sigma factor [Bryobacteraceae bacterium]
MRETSALQSSPGFEALFYGHHERITRMIARIIRDPGRAEEVAVEVFWKFWRTPKAHCSMAVGWLHRTAVRMSINELRRQARATRKEALAQTADDPHDPERIAAASQEQEHVRTVLAEIRRRDAELLLLRSSGLSYEDLAAALDLNPASVGTLLSRAQQAFRKEYVKRFGDTRNER